MNRSTIVAALLGGALCIGTTGDAGARAAPGGGDGGSSLTSQEPVLVYNYRGLTFSGTVHTQLAVYNSGFATIARLDEDFFPPATDQDVQIASVGATGAKQLLRMLAFAGAFTLSDQPDQVSDVPVHTVTVFRGATEASAHSFSYFGGVGGYAGVDAVVTAFIAETFPSF